MDSKANKVPEDRVDEQHRQLSELLASSNSARNAAAHSPQGASSGPGEEPDSLPMGEEAVPPHFASGGPEKPAGSLAANPAGVVTASGLDARSAWDRVQLARHPQRPHALDYIDRIFSGFQEIHGDRNFGDDAAIVCGLARLDDQPVVVIGQQKGRDTKQKLTRNFGMPKPEGYRKALRAMKLAEKFGRPIFTLLDTPGAYPGIDAEERGQAEAIARNLFAMSQIRTPILVTCIGEGGSGGALALGVGNRVLMLENAVYSVISPESCAAIVWRDSSKAEQAANALKLTAEDLMGLGLVDEVVKEPPEGAQADHDGAAELLASALKENLRRLNQLSETELVEERYGKFRAMGSFFGQDA
jgi:acetyl-CoA carboxylase carboxyl transferase subunit alpha